MLLSSLVTASSRLYTYNMKRRKDNSHEDSDSEFSVINFFMTFKVELEGCKEPPLRDEDIVINRDAYEALGSERSFRRPFATIGLPFASSDTRVRFTCEFFEESFCLTLPDFFGPVFMPYEAIDDSEQVAAKKLANFLTALSNGQLSFLVTLDSEADLVHSIELLYRAPGAKQYSVLGSLLFFLGKRKKTPSKEALATKHDTNDAALGDVEVSRRLARELLLSESEDAPVIRKVISDLDEPLYAEDAKKAIDKYAEEKAAEVMRKFDAWTGYDYGGDYKNASFMSLYVHYLALRHANILWMSVAILLLFGLFVGWSDYTASLLVSAAVLGIAMRLIKTKVPARLYAVARGILGYMVSSLALYLLFSVENKGLFAWILTIALAAEIAECFLYDLYVSVQRKLGKNTQE